MHATAWPEELDLGPGDTGFLSLAVTNTSAVIDAYRVQLFGLDPEWVQIEPQRLSLFPGETENFGIQVSLPEDYPSSERRLAVNVVSEADAAAFSMVHIDLAVRPQTDTTVTLDPSLITSGRSATFGIVVSNVGNTSVTAVPFGIDPEDLANFDFQPPRVVVPPGRNQVVQVTVKGGRSWVGQPRARTFTFGVDAEKRCETLGTFIQRPRIGRWMISLLGLLTAALLFAVVLSFSFNKVVDKATVADEVLNAALKQEDAGGAVVPTNPGSVSGSLLSTTTGEGLAGVQAELFVADQLDVPTKTSVTDDQGAFTINDLASGEYLVRLTGAGVGTLWFPDGVVSADVDPIELTTGQNLELPPASIGGVPVEDPAGVVLTLVVAGQLAPGTDAVVATVPLGADGSFNMPDVPTPGDYVLIVEQPGAATASREIRLEPGEQLDNVEIALKPGNGIVSGSVSSPDGLLGGALITATDGTNTIETVSLTEGNVGSFALRNLATPSQYTITISKDGFSPETRTVALGDAQDVGNFSSRLLPAVGSVRGLVTLGDLPPRGLSISISGGDINRQTRVVSQGLGTGSYAFTRLPAPATYTLTFSGAGTIPQVRVVDLDPNSGNQNLSGIDVALSTASTTVRGEVRNAADDLLPRADVVLSDGTTVFRFQSGDEPAGAFEFSNVAPGAYTLTASRKGTVPVVRLVNITANEATPFFGLTLGRAADISGVVVGTNGINDFDPGSQRVELRLFASNQFPAGETIQRVVTDDNGAYSFPEIDAPETYIVAVYATVNSGEPLDSQIISTKPSDQNNATDFKVAL
jgi:hypothetical protein